MKAAASFVTIGDMAGNNINLPSGSLTLHSIFVLTFLGASSKISRRLRGRSKQSTNKFISYL